MSLNTQPEDIIGHLCSFLHFEDILSLKRTCKYLTCVTKYAIDPRYYIPVKNGIVDLRTGKLTNKYKQNYFTRELLVEWKGLDYKTPDIDKYMDEIMQDSEWVDRFPYSKSITQLEQVWHDNKDLKDYFQKLLGYYITGFIHEKLFVVWYGKRASGKRTLGWFLKELLGSYWDSKDDLRGARYPDGGYFCSNWYGYKEARMLFCNYIRPLGFKLESNNIKPFVYSGNIIHSRFMFHNQFKFKRQSKFTMITNDKLDFELTGRLKHYLTVIPFNTVFSYDYTIFDPYKLDSLKPHIDQLLVWLVKGSIKYFKHGLSNPPSAVTRATEEFLSKPM